MIEPHTNDPLQSLPKRDAAVIGFGLTLAFLLISGILGYTNARRLAANHRLVAHTHEVIGGLEVLLSTVKDAETGERGYLLTEDQTYLKPFNDALERIQNELAGLRQLLSDNPAQQDRLAAVEKIVAVRLDILKQGTGLIRTGDRAAAIELIKSGTGKTVMDELRTDIAAMQQVERDFLRQRDADAARTSAAVYWSIFLSTLIGVLLVGFVFYLSQRHIRQQQAAALIVAEERERLRTTLASIGDGVIATDTEGRITTMNAVAETLTGWTKATAIGQPLEDVFRIVNETTRNAVENPVTKALREGVIVGLANHTVLIAKDGVERPIDDSAAPIRCQEGTIVGCVLVFRDVTERRRSEDQNAERMQAARLLASIVESSDDAIISKTLEGIVQSWNAGAERLFGYSVEQAVDRHISFLFPTDRLNEEDQIIARLRAGERVEHFDTVRVRSDGQSVEVSLTISPIRDDAGRVIGASKIARDITERKRLENELRQTTADLSEADRRKNEFLAMLAHELRNPLAPIRNSLQVLRLTGDNQEIRPATEMMERQVAQMVRLIDDLLDVSRISRGKMTLRRERIELASVINHAVEAARPLCGSLEHELTVELPSEPIYLNADAARLTQVIGNLLNNACKFTDRGGRIQLALEQQNDQAVIRVSDNGMGIAAEQLPRIFEMFTQVDTSLERPQSGLGIGLTLVKNLVEMHGGTIDVKSTGVGQGSEFIVRLPILDEPVVHAMPAELPASQPPTPARRILVVDDNRDSATSLAMLLKFTGNDTRTAHDGLDAVATAETFQPDLILLDIGLPKLNGYEVCRRIREKPWGKTITLIALTGWGQEEDRQKSRDAGFHGHLVKPVDLAVLTKLLAELNAPPR